MPPFDGHSGKDHPAWWSGAQAQEAGPEARETQRVVRIEAEREELSSHLAPHLRSADRRPQTGRVLPAHEKQRQGARGLPRNANEPEGDGPAHDCVRVAAHRNPVDLQVDARPSDPSPRNQSPGRPHLLTARLRSPERAYRPSDSVADRFAGVSDGFSRPRGASSVPPVSDRPFRSLRRGAALACRGMGRAARRRHVARTGDERTLYIHRHLGCPRICAGAAIATLEQPSSVSCHLFAGLR